MSEELLAKLDEYTRALKSLQEPCSRRLLRYPDLSQAIASMKAGLEKNLPPGSPLFAIFDRTRQEHTTWHVQSISPYVIPKDCEEITFWLGVLEELKRELNPERRPLTNQEIDRLPAAARDDLLKAESRLAQGDLTGAVTAACAAIDSAVGVVYAASGLGDPTAASFQERISKALRAQGVLPDLDEALRAIKWPEREIKPFRDNLIGSINQAAYILQTLRANMGDVHGSRPVISALVYDSIKWATIILRLLHRE